MDIRSCVSGTRWTCSTCSPPQTHTGLQSREERGAYRRMSMSITDQWLDTIIGSIIYRQICRAMIQWWIAWTVHLFTQVVEFTTIYDRIGKDAAMALRGRLACLVDHLGYLDLNYLGCSLNSEFYGLRRTGENLGRVQKLTALLCMFRVPGT